MPERTSMPTKKSKLENDFERMVPEYHRHSIIYGEHMVRYGAAQDLVAGKVVLDIASGSGYGTALLAEKAKKVYGVDVFKDAVDYASENYGRKNVEYLVGDGVQIPLSDASVDMVVSFETIEHIEAYEQFMVEAKRVLKPDGVLLLSTPNDVEFAEGNHFHIHEFKHKELQDLVKKYFKNCKEYFQANWVYTGIHTKDELTTEWRKDLQVMNVEELKIDQALYFFMLCSNRPITEKIESFGMLSEHYSARALQTKHQLTDQHIQNITDVSNARLAEVEKLRNHIKELDEQLTHIHNSKAWQLASKAVHVKRKITRK